MRGLTRQFMTMGGPVLQIAAAILIAANVRAQDTPASVGDSAPLTITGVTASNHYIQYQGQVFNPNTQQPAANTVISAQFTFYRDPAGTQLVWSELKQITTNIDGLFNTNLGDTVPFDLNIFNGDDLYLGVNFNGEEIRPLQPIGYAPYAVFARNADSLDGLGSHEFARVIAYGFVGSGGDKESGTDGWSSRRTNIDGEDVYLIDIDDVDYSFRQYTTIVTPACDRAIMVGTGSVDDEDLLIDVFDANGNRTTCNFQFAVFRRS